MGSLHTDRAYRVAREKRAGAATNRETWDYLMDLSKRELAEIAIHLAATCTDSYDEAFENGDALRRLRDEHAILKDNGLI